MANRARQNLAGVLLAMGRPSETVGLAEAALTAHDKVHGHNHGRTKESARITADVLIALRRAEEGKALRQKYAIEREGS